ncbi:MAG: hypothetical protein RL291_122, partial [Pseudomonadota bacterium]
ALELRAVAELDGTIRPAASKLPSDLGAALFAAVGNGRPIAVRDAASAPHLKQLFAANPGLATTKSRIDVPIMLEGMIGGLMVISASRQIRDWTPDDIQFSREVAVFATIAVERDRLRSSEEARLVGVSQLADIGQRETDRVARVASSQAAISRFLTGRAFRSGSRTEAVTELLEILRGELACDRCSLWLGSPEDDQFRVAGLVARPGLRDTMFSAVTWNQVPTYGAALKNGHMLVAPKATLAPHLKDLLAQVPALSELKSRIDLPLSRDGQFVGLIIIAQYQHHIDWTQDQTQFVQEIGTLMLLVLEKHDRLEIAAREAATLQRLLTHRDTISNVLASREFQRGTRDEALGAALRSVVTTFGADRAAVWLNCGDGQECSNVCMVERDLKFNFNHGAFDWRQLPRLRERLQSKDVLCTADPNNADYLKEVISFFPELAALKARADIPLFRDDRFIGMIIVSFHTETVDWTPDQIQYLREMGTITLLAIERHERQVASAQLEAENQRRKAAESSARSREAALRTLFAAASDENTDPQSTLQNLVQVARREFGIDRSVLWLTGEDKTTCDIVAKDDEIPEWTGGFVSIDFNRNKLYHAALALGEPILTTDTSQAPHLADIMATHPMTRCLLSRIDIPLVQSGQVRGMLVGSTRGRAKQWDAEDALFGRAIASVALIVLERRRRKTVEEGLRVANREAAEANKAKSLFLANMSHEIRTPMNGVFGMTDLLMRTNLDENQTRLVMTINRSAQSLLTIINDILDISRIEAGRLEVDRAAFDLHATIESAVQLFIDDAQQKSIDLSLYIGNDVPVGIIGDAGRLRQVLINLIGNATKFTTEGEVAVRLTKHVATDGCSKLLIS